MQALHPRLCILIRLKLLNADFVCEYASNIQFRVPGERKDHVHLLLGAFYLGCFYYPAIQLTRAGEVWPARGNTGTPLLAIVFTFSMETDSRCKSMYALKAAGDLQHVS